jgi:4a-hydroxytetrahydrobiopterin dehydratase
MASQLASEHCQRLPQGSAALSHTSILGYLAQLTGWHLDEKYQYIRKRYALTNYQNTIAFVNAVAAIAIQEDHHPDMQVSYKECTVSWSTHSVNGLSKNDFICAAKTDAVFDS